VSATEDGDLRALLLTFSPKARDDLRRVLIRDDADRDAIASTLMRYRDQNGTGPSADDGSGQPSSGSSRSGQGATSTSLPSGSARVHHSGACPSYTMRPPASIAAAMRPSACSCGT
jgi:hypothetical protein